MPSSGLLSHMLSLYLSFGGDASLSQWLWHFPFPSSAHEVLVSPVLQRPKLVFSVFNHIHFSVHAMIFPCSFNSCSHSDQCRDSFHVFIGHLSICHFKIRWLLINGLAEWFFTAFMYRAFPRNELLTFFAVPFYFILFFLSSLFLTPKVLNFKCVELCIFYFVAYTSG